MCGYVCAEQCIWVAFGTAPRWLRARAHVRVRMYVCVWHCCHYRLTTIDNSCQLAVVEVIGALCAWGLFLGVGPQNSEYAMIAGLRQLQI